MKLQVKGIRSILPSIVRQIEKVTEKVADQSAERLLEDLVLSTPIDTGFARSQWTLKNTSAPLGVTYYTSRSTPLFGLNRTYVFSNNAPYIDVLNTGWSQQAPAFFIESTIYKNGYKITGTIVPKRK
jgi:hypothetical protein